MNLRLLSCEQFELLCIRLLQAEGFELQMQSGRSLDIGVDFILSSPEHTKWVIEVKHWNRSVTPTVLFRSAAYQIDNARNFLNADAALLIISGQLRPSLLDSIEVDKSFHVWDGSKLQELLQKHPDIRDAFTALIQAQSAIQEPTAEPKLVDARARELLGCLETLGKGEDHWKDFEDLCVEILNYAFMPPLRTPKIQSRSEDGLDRRDAVYSIGHGHIFWDNLRNECRTRFAVAEFKNYTHTPGQKEVESIQQYLFTKAMRSFGILCSRLPASESALKARRRAWLEFEKLIVLLADEDLKEILQAKALGDDPCDILDAQLNEFFTVLTP